MRMGWLLGWAVPEPWFAPLVREAFPEAQHEFFPAEPAAMERLRASGPFAWTVGYSLGSHLLLAAQARGAHFGRVALLAPIFAFPREENLGGRVSRTQVQWLARALQRDSAPALADFYRRAALDVPAELAAGDKTENLRWGLAELERGRVEPPLPAGWRAWCGGADALLDAERLRELAPETQVVAGATHHPRELLRALAEDRMNAPVLAAPGGATATAALVKSFGRAARAYERHARVQVALAEWLSEWVPADRTGRALEIGAGSGVFTRRVMPWPGEFVASDLSPAMCAAGQESFPGVEWRVLAAEEPGGGPWDRIFSSAMLQWMAEPEAMFTAWRRQLAPGGRILAGLFVDESLGELRALVGDDGPLTWRTVDEWRRCIAAGGLRVVRDAEVRRVFRYETAQAFVRSIHATGAAPLRRMPPGRLRRLLREYDERYRDGAGVRATWKFYRFEAAHASE